MKSNSLGPIAETYSELQSLNLLFEANRSPPIPELASEQEALLACWQSIEIALINLELLFIRLGSTAKDQYVNELGVVGPWLVGLGKIVMNLLSTSSIIASEKKGNLICLYDSPNLIKLTEAQHNFAILVSNSNQLDSVTSSGNETYFLSYIHLFREVMKHGAIYVNWDSYDSFTSPNAVREAVLELERSVATS